MPILKEDSDSPPEHLLQAIWQHQRLRRDQLATLDGQTVRVLHPGFHNREGGPDFREALIQLGDAPALRGDVEVDIRASGWRAHGHYRNPAFRQVILHVVWEGDKAAPDGPPLLALRHALDAPLGELSLWLGGESDGSLPEELRGRCCAPLGGLTPAQRLDLLQQAAHVRLRSKASQFQARARHAGWEQALWEGLFRALGYKHNAWPMQHLGELRPFWAPPPNANASPGIVSRLDLQTRLLGLSGLLPADLTHRGASADDYLRRLWDVWWRERNQLGDLILPRAVWRLHGLRPANRPERRLALAAAWAARGDLVSRLEAWCSAELPGARMTSALLDALQPAPDDFWSWHWTLRSPRLAQAQPLVGAPRVTDLAVNVVLPWLWARALEGQRPAVRQRLEDRYFSWPPAEDNSILRLARQRLLGGARRGELPGAAAQQGLLQIVRDFCAASNALCENCRLPRIVEELRRTEEAGPVFSHSKPVG